MHRLRAAEAMYNYRLDLGIGDNISLSLEDDDFIGDDGELANYCGRKFEKVFAAILSNKSNLCKYLNDGDYIDNGYYYAVFYNVLRVIAIKTNGLRDIYATTDIRKLKSHGSPKADVLAFFSYFNGDDTTLTFSCKSSKSSTVTVHEYAADTFADVLAPTDDNLRQLLRKFQSAGNRKDMGPSQAIALQNALKPYRSKLELWALGGYGAPDVTENQCAKYLVFHDKKTNRIAIHEINEYIRLLKRKRGRNSGFGTIFDWTYHHDTRGNTIVLKVRVLR